MHYFSLMLFSMDIFLSFFSIAHIFLAHENFRERETHDM
jgi:hypothetical protein